jgi:uncharacterized protein YbaP (TraB family)
MHRTLMVIVLALVGLFQNTAWSQRVADLKAREQAVNRGTLFRVTQGGHSAWLFGTVHVGQASFYPLEPVVLGALAGADQVAVEFDINDRAALQAALAKHGMLTAPKTLKTTVSANTWMQLQAALKKANLPLDVVAQMKPWTVSTILLALALEQNGFAREQGIEVYLLAQAAKLGKPVVSLESADYQLGLFDQLDDKQQEAFLRECLQSITQGKLRQQSQQVMDAWGRADSAAVEKLLDKELAEATVTADFTKRVLLAQRNPPMTAAIEQLMESQASTFVAIGMLHLIGADSVPKLLERRGYKVERIY